MIRNRLFGTAILLLLFASLAQAAAPAEPWHQCPSVGYDTSCGVLIVINADNTVSIYTSSSQGPFDAHDDTLIGVQNNSANPIPSLSITGPTAAFGFSGDGICDTYSGFTPPPHPAGCPYGPTGYEGPGVSFTVSGGFSKNACGFGYAGPWVCSNTSTASSGTVNFNPAIPAGGTAYFGLQETINGSQLNVTPPPPPPTPSNVETSNNPPQGCTPPPSVSSFQTTVSTVYVFFILNGVHSTDQVADVWLTPSGSTYTPASTTWQSASGNVCYTDNLNISNNTPSTMPGTWTVQILVNQVVLTTVQFTVNLTPLGFFPLTPCRAVDTRSSQGKSGSFGPPGLTAFIGRNFPLVSSGCSLPSSAVAYSLNFTAVPPDPLDFLSVWPQGQAYPNVSTLNSPAGNIIANAAIVPSGTGGGITTAAGENTDLIVDTNGYFAPPNGQELAFYVLRPCRVVDTRTTQNKTGAFGPPALAAYAGRNFPITSSDCNIPASAKAYSLNFTVLPQNHLDFLSTWPAGQPYPNVSTLNSTDGSIIANAAIVPAGTNGDIIVLAGNPTDLIIDINGYFAAPGSPGALHLYTLPPCRVADTRSSQPFTGAFGPPSLGAYSGRNFPLPSGTCGIPATAVAYSLNVTVVPQGNFLDFLSIWPQGQPYPNVSTLNSPKGAIIANAAIVPAGTNGGITVLAAQPTDLIIDVNGYFAP